jgi:hypothetical protein
VRGGAVVISRCTILTTHYYRGIGDIIAPFVSSSYDGKIALKAESAEDLLVGVDADTLSGYSSHT